MTEQNTKPAMTNTRFEHADILFTAVKEELDQENNAKIRVSGMSMWPFLCHGRDFVILKAASPEKLKVGDIVLMKGKNDAYLLHRITAITTDQIQTTGDGKLERDGWFPRENVIGLVDSIVRKGREIPCRNIFLQVTAWIWRISFPIRGGLLKILEFLLRVKNICQKR